LILETIIKYVAQKYPNFRVKICQNSDKFTVSYNKKLLLTFSCDYNSFCLYFSLAYLKDSTQWMKLPQYTPISCSDPNLINYIESEIDNAFNNKKFEFNDGEVIDE